MQRKRVSLTKRMAVQAALVACAALVGWIFWAAWRETLLAAYWENELAATDGKEGDAGGLSVARTNEAVDSLLKLGRPGLCSVVRALGYPREEVARAASAALDHLLSCCENGPASEAASSLENLAAALADNVDGLPVASRPRAAKLAMRLVAWLQKTSPFDSGRMAAACDRVLRACDGSPDGYVRSTRQPPKATTARAAETRKQGEGDQVVHARTVLPADHSMYLELAALTPPELPRAGGTNDAPPRLLLSTEGRRLAANDAAGTSDAAAVSDGRLAHGRESDPGTSPARGLRELDSLDLFARLTEPDEAQAAAELISRGFSPRQIDVGRHLLSHDPAERLRWAEVLPGIRGIDARFWLLRLSHDTNLQVRRSAVGLLATDRDPEVIRRLRQIAVEETDADLRDQANRALEILEGER